MNQKTEMPINDKPISKWLGQILNEPAFKLGEVLMSVRLLMGLLFVLIAVATGMTLHWFDRLDKLVEGQIQLQNLLLEHTLTDHSKKS